MDFTVSGFTLTSDFCVNIQINPNNIITLKTLCSPDILIYDLKKIILKELELNNIDRIGLKFNGQFMENTNTLKDYNITDTKHIIQLFFAPNDANQKDFDNAKFSFISDDIDTSQSFNITQPLLYISSNNNNSSYYNKYTPTGNTSYHTMATSYRDTINNGIKYSKLLGYCLVIIGVGILVVNAVAFYYQHKVYREYSKNPSDCEMLNEICNGQCDVFARNGPARTFDLGHYFIGNFVCNIIVLGSVVIGVLVYYICNRNNINVDKRKICGLMVPGFTLFVVYIPMLIYNSIIVWIDFNKIRLNCDNNNEFYNIIINRYSICNYIQIFWLYILAPFMCIAFCYVCTY